MRWPATERFYGFGRLVGLILAGCPVVRLFAAYLRAQEEDLRNPKLGTAPGWWHYFHHPQSRGRFIRRRPIGGLIRSRPEHLAPTDRRRCRPTPELCSELERRADRSAACGPLRRESRRALPRHNALGSRAVLGQGPQGRFLETSTPKPRGSGTDPLSVKGSSDGAALCPSITSMSGRRLQLEAAIGGRVGGSAADGSGRAMAELALPCRRMGPQLRYYHN